MKRKIGAFTFAFILIFQAIPASSANIPDEQFLFTYSTVFKDEPPKSPWYGVWFSDKPNYPSFPILEGKRDGKTVAICSSIDEEKCKSINDFSYVANYPFCQKTSDLDCIQEVFALDSSGKKIKSNNVEYLPKNPTTTVIGTWRYPSGSSKEIFDLPGVTHKGNSTKYAIEVTMQNSFSIDDRTNPNSSARTWDPMFFVNISPINIVKKSMDLPYICDGTTGGNSICQPKSFDRNCVVADVDRCGLGNAFPSNYTFGVSIRMQTPIYGWLQGRIGRAEFTSEKISGGSLLTVQGEPLIVPSIAGGGDFETFLSPDLKSKHQKDLASRAYPYFDNYTAASGTSSLEALKMWLPVLGDKATVMPSVWSLRSIDKKEFAVSGLQAGRCIVTAMKNGIGGMVSSNATAYSSGPPIFNEVTQSLDYKVAAPHFTPTGQVFKGYYNLKMTADTARCIYGFGAIPMEATISVVSEDGEVVVATSIVRSDDKWVELSAANFNFSSPTIRVKFRESLTQSVPLTPKKVATTKKTITCLKGKVTKKLTGANPKCPTGYKKG